LEGYEKADASTTSLYDNHSAPCDAPHWPLFPQKTRKKQGVLCIARPTLGALGNSFIDPLTPNQQTFSYKKPSQ
jgi:hypothetical protein